jgi:signal transduction histidine kinase
LLSNAIKYSPKGETILISVQTDNDTLEMTVKDKGVGIPINELEFIFNKFQQSSATEDGSGGSGLGLAICREIVDGHHGSLGAVNNPEGGACFYFKIPIVQIAMAKCD